MHEKTTDYIELVAPSQGQGRRESIVHSEGKSSVPQCSRGDPLTSAGSKHPEVLPDNSLRSESSSEFLVLLLPKANSMAATFLSLKSAILTILSGLTLIFILVRFKLSASVYNIHASLHPGLLVFPLGKAFVLCSFVMELGFHFWEGVGS